MVDQFKIMIVLAVMSLYEGVDSFSVAAVIGRTCITVIVIMIITIAMVQEGQSFPRGRRRCKCKVKFLNVLIYVLYAMRTH